MTTGYDQHERDAFDPYTDLECRECDTGLMAIVETHGLGGATEFTVECQECRRSTLATYRQVSSGDWMPDPQEIPTPGEIAEDAQPIPLRRERSLW